MRESPCPYDRTLNELASDPRAYLTAYRVTGNRALSEDAVQEAFCQILQRPPARRDPKELAAYFIHAVRGRALHLLRTGRRARRTEAAYMRTVEWPSTRPDELLGPRETARTIREAIGALPREEREAVSLRYEQRLSEPRAASILGIPRSTFRRRVNRALRRMRGLLMAGGHAVAALPALAGQVRALGMLPPPEKLKKTLLDMIESGSPPAAAPAAGHAMRRGVLANGARTPAKGVPAMCAVALSVLAGMAVRWFSAESPGPRSAAKPEGGLAFAGPEESAERVPGKLAIDLGDGVKMRFVRIEPGAFVRGLGRKPEEVFRRNRQRGDLLELLRTSQPPHRVKLTKPFYLGRFEVTVAQFERFVEATGYRTEAEKDGWGTVYVGGSAKRKALTRKRFRMPQDPNRAYMRFQGGGWAKVRGLNWRTPGIPQGPDHPVVQVSWNDAMAFCAWMSERSGRRARLPVEAEWEYACRAGTTTEYASGDGAGALNRVGWCGYSGNGPRHTTSPVGRFEPNGWGLHDMHGNVWEFCADWHGPYPSGTVTDPRGPATGRRRVQRGGCWYTSPVWCRSAVRAANKPDCRSCHHGFRVALDF